MIFIWLQVTRDGIPQLAPSPVRTSMMLQGGSLRERPTPPATLAQKGKTHQILPGMPSGQRSMIDIYQYYGGP